MLSTAIAATGMLAQELNVEVISNNIANVNTTGFKRQRAEFEDLLYQQQRAVGATSNENGAIVAAGVQIGTGVRAAAVYRIGEQGSLQSTGNNLDMAIQGKGFFEIEMPDGTLGYTRAGSFQLSPQGQIVTADGYVLKPGITVPPTATSVSVNNSGQVVVQVAGQTATQTVGQLELSNFPNEVGLQNLGNNLLGETPASGNPVVGAASSTGFGTILQGFLESSNVNVVTEITNLISAQRAYEMNSKVIQVADQMSSALNNLR